MICPPRSTELNHRCAINANEADGEIACVDEAGRPVFRDLPFRKRECVFIAFDLLFLNVY